MPLAFAAVLITSLLLTGSRAGIIATALGLFVLFILNVRRAGGVQRNDILLLGFAGLLVVAALFAFGDALVGQITAKGLVIRAGR